VDTVGSGSVVEPTPAVLSNDANGAIDGDAPKLMPVTWLPVPSKRSTASPPGEPDAGAAVVTDQEPGRQRRRSKPRLSKVRFHCCIIQATGVLKEHRRLPRR
jgi:hypothetical protein